jgi:mevalonate kinase
LSTIASAPAKLILMGEHAAVYGRPALVAAVDLRLTVRASDDDGPGLRLSVPRLGVDESMSFEAVRATTERLRAAWARYMERPCPETYRALSPGGDDQPTDGPRSGAALLLATAVGETSLDLEETEPAPVRLEVSSEIPVGAGLGSSAAAAVATVAAYLAHRGAVAGPDRSLPLFPDDTHGVFSAGDRERIRRLSLEVERRQHGNPSGIDNSTVLQGGLVRAQRGDDGVEIAPVDAASPLLERLRIVSSGRPAETTGQVVAAVAELESRSPAAFERRWDLIGELTDRFQALLEAPDVRTAETLRLLRRAQASLEELGVVPEPVRSLARAVEARGGAVKISGAGALSGDGGGALILYHPEPAALDHLEALTRLRSFHAPLGAPGARIEECR